MLRKFSIQWGEAFDELDPRFQKERTTTYDFATEAELKAFWLGMKDGGGWNAATMIDTETGEVLNEGAPEDLAESEYDPEAWEASLSRSLRNLRAATRSVLTGQ
jgi:hypothetical protein